MVWSLLAAIGLAFSAGAQDALPTDDPDDPVLQAMTAEVDRAMEARWRRPIRRPTSSPPR